MDAMLDRMTSRHIEEWRAYLNRKAELLNATPETSELETLKNKVGSDLGKPDVFGGR